MQTVFTPGELRDIDKIRSAAQALDLEEIPWPEVVIPVGGADHVVKLTASDGDIYNLVVEDA